VTETYLRYCPDCGEEYQPHMTRCIDCGSALKEKLDGESMEYAAPPEREPESSLPPGDYGRVAAGLSAQVVEPLVRVFVEAGIPVKVESIGYGLCLSVRGEDRSAVVAILEREGVIPIQPEATTPAVAAEGGPCPACGSNLEPGTVECPECGLLLGGAACESCGAELSPTDQACPACGRSPDEEAS
jgi:predicted amidophosphoribosyltransferase